MLYKSSIEIDSVYQWYQNTKNIVNTLSSQDSELPNSTSHLCNKIIQLSIQNSDLSKKYNTYLQLISTINSYNQVLSQIQQLSLQNNCLICMQRPINRVLIPCGHTCCSNCYKEYKQKVSFSKKKQCFLCRSYVESTNKLYIL